MQSLFLGKGEAADSALQKEHARLSSACEMRDAGRHRVDALFVHVAGYSVIRRLHVRCVCRA